MAAWTGSDLSISSSMMADLGSRTSGEDAPKDPYLAALAGAVKGRVERTVAMEAVWRNWRRVVVGVDMERAVDLWLMLGDTFGENALAEPSMAAVDRTPEIFMLFVYYIINDVSRDGVSRGYIH